MKLEDLERDILGAYLNYDNNDLKTAIRQLDMSFDSLLREEKSLDPFWMDISKNVYKAIILNNFSKGIKISVKELRDMLNNQDVIYSNIIEFCNKFENNGETSFTTNLKKISENPLKSAIQILKENIDKISDNITGKDTNNKIQDIKCPACGNIIKMNWANVPSTEKKVDFRCSKCGTFIMRKNPYAVENSDNIVSNDNNEQLIKELRDFIKNSSKINIFEDWNSCKNDNPQLKEFFNETEKEAIQELIRAQDKATILKHSLKSYTTIPDPYGELGLNNLIITYFGLQSIYDRKLENNNGLFESLSIDNVGLFRAVLIINIVAIMYHITDNNLPMGLKLIFERKEFVNILGPIVKEFLPKVIPSINEIKFFYKQ